MDNRLLIKLNFVESRSKSFVIGKGPAVCVCAIEFNENIRIPGLSSLRTIFCNFFPPLHCFLFFYVLDPSIHPYSFTGQSFFSQVTVCGIYIAEGRVLDVNKRTVTKECCRG